MALRKEWDAVKGLKRVYGKVIEKNNDGITVKTRKKAPVHIPFEELAQDNVTVIVWKGGDHGIAVGCTIDVLWWDGPADLSELLGPICPRFDENLSPMEDDFSDEDLPF